MAENVYLLEIEPGHRIDGDGWSQLTADYFYVADQVNDRVKKHLCSDLSYDSKIGSSGAGNDQFSSPTDVCSDGESIYITDAGANDRIMKRLCSDLSYDSKIGSNGTGNDEFADPYSICTDNTYLYIADAGNDRIVKRKCSDLSFVSKIGSTGTGNDEFNDPRGICTDGTHLYVSDMRNHRIVKRKCSDLSYVDEIGSSGTGDDKFRYPMDICTDNTYLYIADWDNTRIKKHKCLDLTYVAKTSGTAPNAFTAPHGIATDGTHVYVSDKDDDYIQKRACADLSFDSKIGGTGAGDDQFNSPLGCGYSDEGSGDAYYIPHVEGEPSKVEEDGAALTERATFFLCKDNAGSWYWDSANTRLYVHTTGSDDPVGYIIIAFFWEYLTNAQYVDEDIIFNGNEYLPYLRDEDIPDVTSETSGYQEGGTKQSFGSVRVINAYGRYDSRLTDYIYEAKKIILKAGIKGGNYASYDTYWIGWTGGIKWSEEEIDIDIEDLRTLHA